MTFDELQRGQRYYVGSAKDTLWMKVGDNDAVRVFKVDGKLKVTVAPHAVTLFSPDTKVHEDKGA